MLTPDPQCPFFTRLPRWLTTLSLISLFALPACKPSKSPPSPQNAEATPTPEPTATATPVPTPTPSPTPIHIPRQKLDTARLFNGIRVKSVLDLTAGSTSTAEREEQGSYELQLTLKVRVPRAHTELASLALLNPSLPTLLPWLEGLLASAEVSPEFEALYSRKIARLENNLPRLDLLLSRHDFYDCETILKLQNPETKRVALLVQADMDVDTDGSDGDRLPIPPGTDPYFQPMTSYGWPKQTDNPNPFLAEKEAKLKLIEAELKAAKGLPKEKLDELRNRRGAAKYEVNQLRSKSFLISEADPYIVLPGAMFSTKDPLYTPKFGDYCAVIYGETIYPAILGDAGPSIKMGEASLRLSRQLNPRSTAYSRPVSHLKVTYLVFPNSAEAEPQPPNLDRWREKVEGLLNEMGGTTSAGYGGTLFAWETTAKPVPTPTPTPTPTPEPTATPEGIPSPTPEGLPDQPLPPMPPPAETPNPDLLPVQQNPAGAAGTPPVASP